MARNVVRCSRCGTTLDLSPFDVGQTVACPCGAHLTVPPPEVEHAGEPSADQIPPQARPFEGPPPHAGPWPGPPPGAFGAAYGPPRVQCPEATHALIFGILGFLFGCLGLILGPIAISKANQAQERIKADPRLEGSGMAVAGKILGIIGVIYGVFALAYLIFLLVTLAALHR